MDAGATSGAPEGNADAESCNTSISSSSRNQHKLKSLYFCSIAKAT